MSVLTHILKAIDAGDASAAAQLLPVVYDELRRLAAHKLAQEQPGQTLDATALVHEAYVRLAGGDQPRRYAERSHFYAAAAEAMRRILIDNARKKKSAKHGGLQRRVELHDNLDSSTPANDDVLAIDEALTALAAVDAESAQLVRLRFYAGLSVEDAAEALGLSRASAYRTWSFAKAWLRTRLDQ